MRKLYCSNGGFKLVVLVGKGTCIGFAFSLAILSSSFVSARYSFVTFGQIAIPFSFLGANDILF